jgi:hypothetical protein
VLLELEDRVRVVEEDIRVEHEGLADLAVHFGETVHPGCGRVAFGDRRALVLW